MKHRLVAIQVANTDISPSDNREDMATLKHNDPNSDHLGSSDPGSGPIRLEPSGRDREERILPNKQRYLDLIDWTLFGRVVKQLRQKLDLTQIELCQKANLDNTYISQIENGKKPNVSIAYIACLAEALEVFPEYLILIAMRTPPQTEEAAKMYESLKQRIIEDLRLNISL